MKRYRRIGVAGLVAALWAAGPVAAQEGDPEAGRLKAITCMGCHGIKNYANIYPSFHVPKLGGQHEAYIRAALMAYKSGARKHPTMNAQASSLSKQDIADIAAYLAQAPKE